MNPKDMIVLLKYNSKKNSGTTLETSNIKSMRVPWTFIIYLEFKISWYSFNNTQFNYWYYITPIIKRSIVKTVNSRTSSNKDKSLLNRKSELVNKSWYQIKSLLIIVKRNDTMDLVLYIYCSLSENLFYWGFVLYRNQLIDSQCGLIGWLLYSAFNISVFVYFR